MAARDKKIAKLAEDDPALYAEYKREQRLNDGIKHFVHESGRFPLTSFGRLNTYSLFAEASQTVIAAAARYGLILPTGIATDSFNQHFFSSLVRNSKLVSFLDFENEAFLLSRAVHHSVRFCLLTVCGSAARVDLADFAFSTRYMRDLSNRRFSMPSEEILLVNPNTGTTPVFRSRRDAEITIGIYKRVPVLWREDPEENPWNLSFLIMFMMNTDSGLFHTADNGDVLPLYEAKMIHYFDHRYGTYEGQTQAQANLGTLPRLSRDQHDDPDFSVMPRYWLERAEVDSRLSRRSWDKGWLLGWRDVARSTDERTVISAFIPRAAVGDKYLLAFTEMGAYLLQANFSSFALDYVARQKSAGTALKFYLIKQLPILLPSVLKDAAPFIRSRVLELTYTAWDMASFARDLDDGGPPFHWDEERRFVMRAELDAVFFHLYGINRDDVDYIMETFPIVRRRDVAAYGSYRTKEAILRIYDAMAAAKSARVPYQSEFPASWPGAPSPRPLT